MVNKGFVTILDRDDYQAKPGSVGVPPPLFEMRIVDEDGNDVPPGVVGEIVGRGPITMPGYYKRPDLTAQAIRDGWLHSVDLGYVDEDGFLYLVDRQKDMIISGRVNVYPRDIENERAFTREQLVHARLEWHTNSVGWFYGFKLHLLINDEGELLAIKLTLANVDDRVSVPEMTQSLFGKLFGDKGYISQALVELLFGRGVQLITKLKNNMKNKLLPPTVRLLMRVCGR